MWKTVPSSGGSAESLNGLTDVEVSSTPLNGQVLTYDDIAQKWVAKNLVTDGISVSASPWTGKKWLAIGDSITNYDYSTTSSYHKLIASQVGLTSVNEGWIGYGYFNAHNKYYTRIDNNQIDLTADLVTVFLGTNDWGENGYPTPVALSPLGQLGDTEKTQSFYGAVDYTLSQLTKKFNGKPIGVITPLPRSDAWNDAVKLGGVTMTQMVDAIIDVANKYSLPVLDLYRQSNFNMWDADFKTSYAADGLHPNDAGHRILARKILSFINTL